MSDGMQSFEDALREQLRPLAPRASLRDRIAGDLAAEPVADIVPFVEAPRPSGLRSIAAVLVVLLSLSALVWTLDRPGGSEPVLADLSPPGAEAVPVGMEEVRSYLVDSRDEGVVQLPGGMPARRLAYDTLEEVTWSGGSPDERFVQQRPRSEVVYVSLAAY